MKSILPRLGAIVTACACVGLSAASAAPITSVTVDGELRPDDIDVSGPFAGVEVIYYDVRSETFVDPIDGTISYLVDENINVIVSADSAAGTFQNAIFDHTRVDFRECRSGPDCSVEEPFRPMRDMLEADGYAFDDLGTFERGSGGGSLRLIEGFLTGSVDGQLVSDIGGYLILDFVTPDRREGTVRLEFGDYAADAVPLPAAALLFLTGVGGIFARRLAA